MKTQFACSLGSVVALALFSTAPVREALCQGAAPEGVVSINLGPAASHPPVTETDWDSAVVLDHFLQARGETASLTGTKAWVAWDEQNLYVRFWCADPNPVSRSGARLKRTDSVNVYLRPPGAALEDVWRFGINEAGEKTNTYAGQPQNAFEGEARVQDDAWTARFTIPWTVVVGGRPDKPFGLQLARLRYISDEVLSPSALDPHDGPAAADEFMETALGEEPAVHTAAPGLVTLPSGVRRWEFPSAVEVLGVADRKAIWNLQQQLSQATSAQNFAERIRLAGAWYNLLMQEGLSFNWETGQFIVLQGQSFPWNARQTINEALRNGNEEAAYSVLDSLLKHFDAVSRSWFADESPGSIREDQWTQLDTLAKATVKDCRIELTGSAGKHPARLFVSFPALGGVRLSGEARGFFDVAAAPFKSRKTARGITASNGPYQVDIQLKPRWKISVKAEGQAGEGWEFEQGGAAFRFSPGGKILAVDLRENLEPREAVYGFGEHFDQFNHRGHILNLWQEDAWDATVLGAPRNESYKVIPLWHSTRGYSVFWNSSYRMRADIGCLDPDRYRLTVSGPVLDLYVWPTAPLTALEAYTTLTGKPVLPPRWAFEPWAGGGGGRWGRTNPALAQITVMKRFHELDIPHSGLYAEGSGSSDPRLFAAMEPLGIHVFTWHRSQVRNMEALLPDVPTNELPEMRWADGTPVGYPRGHPLAGHFPYIDFTHPQALEVTRAEWRRYFDLGVSGSMIDFGDLVPTDAVFHDGSCGDAMHNFYAYGYHRTVSQAFRERCGDDFVLFARGGAPGSQAFVENFAGDHPANFAGLKAALLGTLSAATAAFSNYGSDLGGYDGKGDEEVYLRWVEWSAFSPIMRAHGNQPREPWFYSDAAVDVYKRYAWVRENLVDYIENAAFHAHETGAPIAQPLALAFPKEPSLATIDDEYMFGPDLLVAPVRAGGEQRDIVLPGGRWTSLWDGSVLAGVATRHVRVPVDEIPVLLRAGALVPLELSPTLQLGDSMTPGRIEALLATPPQVAGVARQWRGGSPAAEYASEPTATGFRVTLSAAPRVRFLVVTGMEQSPMKVLLDGEDLAPLEGAQVAARPPGWYVTKDHRLIVRLPQNLKQTVEISTR
jgi:alpha-glucosidase (family GH31 glycosyl hydrolase)